MGIFKVQSNGKAPAGLAVGDQVVTGGGTYVITGVKTDGSYSSVLLNQSQTTYSYRGKYDTPDSAAAADGGAGAGAATGNGAALPGGAVGAAVGSHSDTKQLEDHYLRLLEQALSGSGGASGGGSSGSGSSGGGGTGRSLSFAQALELASQSLEPSYTQAYREAADRSQQRLDKAGLYDTLYGQSLALQAQNQVSEDLNAAVYELALKLTQESADYTAQQQTTAFKYLLELLKLKAD